MPGSDVAEAIEDTLIGEDAIGGDEIVDQLRIRRTRRRRRRRPRRQGYAHEFGHEISQHARPPGLGR
jgi:hypothetical protein